MNSKTKTKKDFVTELEAMLPKHRVLKAQEKADNILFKIKLSDLRKQMGFTQNDVKAFSQPSLSKIEMRSDLKISTLKDYLKSIGLTLEIKAISKVKTHKNKEFVLLRS